MKTTIAVLHSSHKKKKFNCGKELLDNYLQKQASQDVKRKLSVCFVFIDQEEVIKPDNNKVEKLILNKLSFAFSNSK